MVQKYSIEQVNSIILFVEKKVFLYLKLCTIQSNLSKILKMRPDKELDDYFLLDLQSEVDIYASALADTLLQIKATGAIVDDIEQGYLRWPGDYLGKDVCWSWRIGECSIKYWSKYSDSANLRFDIAN